MERLRRTVRNLATARGLRRHPLGSLVLALVVAMVVAGLSLRPF